MMRRFLASVLFITSVVLLAISSCSLMGMFREYKQADEIKNKLQQIHETAAQPAEQEETQMPQAISKPYEASAPEESRHEAPEEQAAPAREVDAGLVALHEENPDCIYWITIPETDIDYPVMFRPQEKPETRLLRQLFWKRNAVYGRGLRSRVGRQSDYLRTSHE